MSCGKNTAPVEKMIKTQQISNEFQKKEFKERCGHRIHLFISFCLLTSFDSGFDSH